MRIEVERLGVWNIGQVVTVDSHRDAEDTELIGVLESVEKIKDGVYLSVAGDEFYFDNGGTVDVRRGVELGAMTKLADDLGTLATKVETLLQVSLYTSKGESYSHA